MKVQKRSTGGARITRTIPSSYWRQKLNKSQRGHGRLIILGLEQGWEGKDAVSFRRHGDMGDKGGCENVFGGRGGDLVSLSQGPRSCGGLAGSALFSLDRVFFGSAPIVNAPSWMELIARSGVGVSCAVRAWVVATVGLFVMSESAHNSRWFSLEYKTSGPRFCHVLLTRPGLRADVQMIME